MATNPANLAEQIAAPLQPTEVQAQELVQEHQAEREAIHNAVRELLAAMHGGEAGDYGIPETMAGQSRFIIEVAEAIGYFKHFDTREDSKGGLFVSSTELLLRNGEPVTKGDSDEPVYSAVSITEEPPAITVLQNDTERTVYPKRVTLNLGAWKLQDTPKGASKEQRKALKAMSDLDKMIKANPKLAADPTIAARLNSIRQASGNTQQK